MQLPLIKPESDWRPPDLGGLPSWEGAKRVAIDVETCDPGLSKKLGPGVRREGSFMCGVSFAIEDGPAAYLPFAHGGGDNLDPEKCLAYLRDQAAVFRGDLVGANLQYDLDWLLESGIGFEPRFFRDVQVAEPLLDELQRRYSLAHIAERWGLPGKDEGLLDEAAGAYGVGAKSGLWALPARYVGAYAEQDVRLPLALLRRQERAIDEQDLWDVFDLESRLLPVLVRMRRRGVRISYEQLDRVESWALAAEGEALDEVYALTGCRVAVGDVWKARALVGALESAGVSVPRTGVSGAPSIKQAWLESLDHPVGRLIVRARQTNKTRTTFVASVRRHAVAGRIHATLHQLRGAGQTDAGSDDEKGGRFGRLSSSDPNLQQQPARDPEIGPMWRAVYLPDEGGEWLVADYSQQEPRWLTHYAERTRCAKAAEAAERYRTDPATDNHAMMAELCGIPRKDAKGIYLGKCYGMGGAKLCRTLGLPTRVTTTRDGRSIEVAGPEGQKLIDQFDRRAPYVRQLATLCERKAKRIGYIRTVLGRRCRFPPKDGGGYDWTHKALNRLIQGSSADQTKKAMVDADAAGIPLQLQVHDELDLTIYDRSTAEDLAEIMRNAVPSNVPAKVDVEIGPDWGHIG